MLLCLATSCSQVPSANSAESTGVRGDVLSLGITYINAMKDSVDNGDMQIEEKIEDLAYELKVVCIENNDYKSFSDKELNFVDKLGEIRIAYEDVVFALNPQYNKGKKEREEALNTFKQLTTTFQDNYE